MAERNLEQFQPRALLKPSILAMAEHVMPRLYVIVAPAGYGKTTVAQLLAARRDRRAYCDFYGVDSVEHAAKILLRGLAEEDGDRALSLGQDVLSAGRDGGRLRDIALRAWREAIADDSLFVIDHLEWLDDKPEIRSLLNDLLSWRHPTRRVALCSRTAIGLRTARYASPHETIFLTAELLRFDRNTITELAARSAISDSELDTIEQRTLGWPVAVLLLMRSAVAGRMASAVDLFTNSDDANLEDFLQNEIVERLSPDQLKAIIAATFVEDATFADIARSLGADDVSDYIHDLLRPIPIVTSNDGNHLAVHPLLRAAIERRYATRKAAVLLDIARKHRSKDDLLRAAQVFLLAGDADAAAASLESLSSQYSLAGVYLFDAPSLEAALLIARIDASTTVRHPVLWASSALAWIYTRPNEDWLNEARAVWRSIRLEGPLMLRVSVVGSYANVAGILGLFEEIYRVFEEFESSLHAEDSIGFTLLLMWRTALSVWQGLPTDVDGAAQQIGLALDVPATRALWNFHVAARNLRCLGDREAEAIALDDAHEAAARSQLPLVRALVAAERIFHAWFWGDDTGFDVRIAQLENTVRPNAIDGFRHLLACCRGRGHIEPVGYETLAFRCMAFLIGASRSNTSENALRCARSAIQAADQSGSWFYKTLARICCGVLETNGASAELFGAAMRCARKTKSSALISSVAAIQARASKTGMLRDFCSRFSSRSTGCKVEIRVLEMKVLRDGNQLDLAPREMELLAALAVAGRIIDREELSQRLWPDRSADSARNNLRAYLLRLRTRIGPGVISTTERQCGIAPQVTIDIAELAMLLRRLASGVHTMSHEDRVALEFAAIVSIDAIETSSRSWEWFAPILPRLGDLVRDAALAQIRDAMRRGEWPIALAHAKRLFDRDSSDETACELTIRAFQKVDDQFGAASALRQHALAVAEEFGSKPSPHLETLVGSGVTSGQTV